MDRTPFGTPTERRSAARRNASQTRPDQTRVFGTAVCGVSGEDQNQSDGHLGECEKLNRAQTWVLVLAGLSADEPTTRPPKAKPLSAKRSLVLASPEMSKLQGWFEKYIREDEHGCWIWHGARFRGGSTSAEFGSASTLTTSSPSRGQ